MAAIQGNEVWNEVWNGLMRTEKLVKKFSTPEDAWKCYLLLCELETVLVRAPIRLRCNDCGHDYQSGMPHHLFCPARVCSLCDELSDHVLPLVNGVRLCEICKEA